MKVDAKIFATLGLSLVGPKDQLALIEGAKVIISTEQQNIEICNVQTNSE